MCAVCTGETQANMYHVINPKEGKTVKSLDTTLLFAT